ncbi:MAG TPA: carboxypeptidase-like regulatory domain-containing protein [Thermoanaerobaculia bacterium]|nr:carboxypeptidase-like regulatory domain-containing protein [Thermoanaerobaculia bacterium]
MRRFRAIALAAALTTIAASPARADAKLPGLLSVIGSVTNAARPVAAVLVIALNLQSFEAVQTYTASDGSFSLPPLRSGIYKIIAVKHGLAPNITTIVPTQPTHRLTLRMENEKQARRKGTSQEIWEIRGSLPADVLHELDAVLESTAVVEYSIPRIRGEMMSMTGVSMSTTPAFAQTALGVQSRIGDTWQLGIRTNVHRIDDPTDESRFGNALAQSSVMSMELRSSPTDAYRVNSTQSWWRYRDEDPVAGNGPRQADVRSHNFEWEHGQSRVAVRYLAQQNLFQQQAADSNLIEIAGDTPVLQGLRNDIGVSLRVTQESLHDATREPMRTADLAANASVLVGRSFILHYGMASRLGIDGTEWAPRSGAELKLTKDTSLIATATYKVFDRTQGALPLPTIVVWTEEGRVLPRYSYSFGLVSKNETTNRFSAIATVTSVDSPLRVVFNDGFDRFWDGLYVDSGDVRRDIRLAYRHDIGNKLAIDVSSTFGTATPATGNTAAKVYITGDLQSIFFPTGTSLAVSFREIQQPQDKSTESYESERVNIRMAQSLHLPIDVKLLLGIEVARVQNSPFLLDPIDPDGTSKKYIGGLAVNF